MSLESVGARVWVIPDGYIPEWSHGPKPEMQSHDTACLLNVSDREAEVQITIYFSDREPISGFRVTVPPRRTKHIRFNELKDPAPVPKGTDYASVFESNVPVIVQHTRLDSRQAEGALMTTLAYSAKPAA